MAFFPCLDLRAFAHVDDGDALADVIAPIAEAVTRANVLTLQRYPELRRTSVYEAGIPYRSQPNGQNRFADMLAVIRQGHADCLPLSAWRAAELRTGGAEAYPIVSWERVPDGGLLFHVTVETPWGFEDPSRELGMVD